MPTNNRTNKVIRMTNTEFVTELMEFNGPIVQVFIIEAIGKYADMVAAKGLDGVKAAFGKNGLISPEAWYEAAHIVKMKTDEKYKS